MESQFNRKVYWKLASIMEFGLKEFSSLFLASWRPCIDLCSSLVESHSFVLLQLVSVSLQSIFVV